MKTQPPLYIVAARRTPQGRFLGKLSGYSSLDLAVSAAEATLEKIGAKYIDLTIVGNVLPPVLNVARQMALKVGVSQESPAFTTNMYCASGLQAMTLACDAIRLGNARVVLCGGTESMTNAPHFLPRSRQGLRLGDAKMVDSLLLGLSDPTIGETMTHTAQRLAEQGNISRDAQDTFAYRSHQKAIAAQEAGAFAEEIVALPELDRDEHPRADTTVEKLGGLRSVLGGESGITAGNASGINDAAAMLVVCDGETAEKHGWKPLAKIGAYTSTGCDPKTMGLGPVHAVRKLCATTNSKLSDFDCIELNEAFAAQALACLQHLEISSDDSRLNAHGGAIALGHPIGASGARLAVHLAHLAAKGSIRRGLASLCVGMGMGIAAVIEPVDAA